MKKYYKLLKFEFEMKKKLLFVCLGNICRSPAAEAVCLHKIYEQGLQDYYEVDSAGTGSWHVGNKADSRMRAAALRRGIEIKSLARQISLHDFYEFDFILTMDKDNLSTVESLSSKAGQQKIANIQPLLKFARKTNIIEVPDPYYGGEKGFEDVLDLLDDAIDGLLASPEIIC